MHVYLRRYGRTSATCITVHALGSLPYKRKWVSAFTAMRTNTRGPHISVQLSVRLCVHVCMLHLRTYSGFGSAEVALTEADKENQRIRRDVASTLPAEDPGNGNSKRD